MALSLLTPWQSSAPLDPAKARARFRGGAYTDADVDLFLAALVLHAGITGMATAALAGQVAKETANFRYGGQVQPGQFNFAGIAATNDGAAGHSFGSIEGGVMGLIAHHGNYLWGAFADWPPTWDDYKTATVRHMEVLASGHAGKVRTIGDYTNGRWAWTPTVPLGSLNNGYARGIVEIGNTLLGGPTVALQKPPVISTPSPNHGYPGDYRPEEICWHITAGTGASALSWLTNPASNASANYVIMEDGKVHELVNPEAGQQGAAWANGQLNKPNMANPPVASWVNAGINPNRRTVSIEHAGQSSAGHGGSLTAAQIAATISLTTWLCSRFGIKPDRTHIIPHSFIDSVNRANCPGFSSAEWSAWIGKIAALVNGATPPSAMLEPVVTERLDWGGKGRIVAQEVTVENTETHKFYSRKKTGDVLEAWREV